MINPEALKTGINKKLKNRECCQNWYKNNKEKANERSLNWLKNNPEYKANYYKKNRERIANYYKNNREKIIKQHLGYYNNNREKAIENSRNYYKNNREKIIEHRRDYYENNPEKAIERSLNWHRNNLMKAKEIAKKCMKNTKLRGMQVVSGLKKPCCIICGCADIRNLEINHKNGGGRKEGLSGIKLYYKIINGERKTNDLEVTCKVCNIAHYSKMKFGSLYKIEYLGIDQQCINRSY